MPTLSLGGQHIEHVHHGARLGRRLPRRHVLIWLTVAAGRTEATARRRIGAACVGTTQRGGVVAFLAPRCETPAWLPAKETGSVGGHPGSRRLGAVRGEGRQRVERSERARCGRFVASSAGNRRERGRGNTAPPCGFGDRREHLGTLLGSPEVGVRVLSRSLPKENPRIEGGLLLEEDLPQVHVASCGKFSSRHTARADVPVGDAAHVLTVEAALEQENVGAAAGDAAPDSGHGDVAGTDGRQRSESDLNDVRTRIPGKARVVCPSKVEREPPIPLSERHALHLARPWTALL